MSIELMIIIAVAIIMSIFLLKKLKNIAVYIIIIMAIGIYFGYDMIGVSNNIMNKGIEFKDGIMEELDLQVEQDRTKTTFHSDGFIATIDYINTEAEFEFIETNENWNKLYKITDKLGTLISEENRDALQAKDDIKNRNLKINRIENKVFIEVKIRKSQ